MRFEIVFGLMALMVFAGCLVTPDTDDGTDNNTGLDEIPKFATCSAIAEEFKNSENRGHWGMEAVMAPTVMTADAGSAKSADYQGAGEYSATNVQVAGVDEADIVKTDGKYIYVISENRLHIIEAYPAENMELVSTLELEDTYPLEMFIEGDTVLLFGQKYSYYGPEDYAVKSAPEYYYPRGDFTVIQMIDVSDREEPEITREVEFEGNYLSSRKMDSTAYFVLRKWQYQVPEEPGEIVPLYRDSTESGEEYGAVAGCSDIGYLPPVDARSFVIIGAVDMSDADAKINKEVIVASGENIYASQENLYVAEVEYRYEPVPLVGEVVGAYESDEKTVVHKFSLEGQDIDYLGSMEAPGHILNQFSMDEHDGYFRIATTSGRLSRYGSTAMNNVYVFDEELGLVGSLEGLAPGESIYSARFMGDRAYLVTFKKVDPLFVIDLSNPEEPEILGKLKIPGYSDYLHPMDENHLIGIGKDTVEAEEGDFAWYQGIKMAVFDVSDVEKPRELHKVVIGDRGTDSYALHDHKAFLYDAKKELLVVPVLLAEIDEGQWGDDMPDNAYGDYVFQGAYVYDLTIEDGFDLRGRITHIDDEDAFDRYGYYYYDYGYAVKRSLYMDDVLYTVSDNRVQANSLDDLKLMGGVELQ